MKVTFENLNNNDTAHDIVFESVTKYASGREKILVSIDGNEYRTFVNVDNKGQRYFKWCGKTYNIIIEGAKL